MSLYVTDTHPLQWYAAGRSRKLGKQARRAFEYAETGRAMIYVPVLVLVELLEQARAGLLLLSESPTAWIDDLLGLPGFAPVDLTHAVVMAGESLYTIPERTDRLIAATALELGVPLITRDAEIANVRGLQTVWS